MWRDEATLLDIVQAGRRIAQFLEGADEVTFWAIRKTVGCGGPATDDWRGTYAVVSGVYFLPSGNSVG